MVGTAGFSAVVEITKTFEPATDGFTTNNERSSEMMEKIKSY